MGASLKALAFLFAGLTAAKPLDPAAHLVARQSAAALITSSTSAGVASPVAKAFAGAVTGLVSGTSLACSVQSLTAATITQGGGVFTQKPELACTCDGDMVAGIGTSIGTDGLGTVTVRPLVCIKARDGVDIC